MRYIPFVLVLLWAPALALAQSHGGGHDSASPYAGETGRSIKSLSEDDLAEIARGGGWGLARAAELNGVPGPTHLLELADEIDLTPAQRTQIEAIRARMQADAITAGTRFVAAERALDSAFAAGAPDADTLARLVTEAGAARAALRLVHLNAHLQTLPLLSEAQVTRYAELRGYASNPCAAVPDGHNASLWRKHNGCD